MIWLNNISSLNPTVPTSMITKTPTPQLGDLEQKDYHWLLVSPQECLLFIKPSPFCPNNQNCVLIYFCTKFTIKAQRRNHFDQVFKRKEKGGRDLWPLPGLRALCLDRALQKTGRKLEENWKKIE